MGNRGVRRRPPDLELITEEARPPLSVVVVSWNAATRLPAMLASLRAQAIDALELVVVDNGSEDGSADLVQREWSDAVVERRMTNTGFAAAAASGITLSRGEVVALLNYDVELAPGYLRNCLATLSDRPELGSVQGVLLRPGGLTVDSAGHQVSRGRWFRNRGENQRPDARPWAPATVFGITGAAGVYRRAMLEDISSVTGHVFDPAFFAYLEDVDLDYRARWRGWESAVITGASAEHVHSGSGGRRRASIQRHIIKNRLLVLYRNEAASNLLADLPWVAGHLAARLVLAAVTAPTALLGVADFLRLIPSQRPVRRAIAGSRRVSNRSMRLWFRAPPDGAIAATRTRGTPPFAGRNENRRLLMVCGEPLGERMAGPAIRTMELGRAACAAGIDVTIAAPAGQGSLTLPRGMRRVPLKRRVLRAELPQHDVVVAGASLLTRFPELVSTRLPLAVDLYVPVPLEAAQLFRRSPPRVLRAIIREAEATQRLELSRSDLVLCANNRQQQLYAGVAAASDPSAQPNFRVVPFGVPDRIPQRGSGRLRAAIPAIAPSDPVLLWGGGLHDWFDPEMLVDAVADVAEDIPSLRLIFLGATPPNHALEPHHAGARALDRARQRRVLDTNVFFLPGWVPYEERGDYFADADVGVSAHGVGLETYYSWRTRLLDYAWAGLPVVATSGDELSARLEVAGAAELAAPGDRAGMAAAIRAVVSDDSRRERASRGALAVADELRWSVVARPFIEWVLDPVVGHGNPPRWAASLALLRMFAYKTALAVSREGPGGLLRRVRRFRDHG